MAQFSVPQFVEIEDKIIGPLTLKQFFVFIGGATIIFILYRLSPSFLVFVPIALPIAGLTLALSFGHFNGRPLSAILFAFMGFLSQPRSFVFRKEAEALPHVKRARETMVSSLPQMTEQQRLSRLHKLTYILDQDVKEEEELIKDKYLHIK